MSFDKNKALIIDPACHSNAGHNADSVLRFAKKLSEQYLVELAISGVSNKIKNSSFKTYEIVNLYPSLYLDLINDTWVTKLYSWYLKLLHRIPGIIVYRAVIARFFVWRLIRKCQLKDGDLIFFPSCDYYYANQFIDAIAKSDLNVSLKLRFIGVLENERISSNWTGRRKILSQLRSIKEKVNLILTAETNRLSDYISSLTGINVKVEVYPLKQNQSLKYESDKYDNTLSISCPGASRSDKGSFDMNHILQESLNRYGNSVMFNIQKIRKGDISWCRNAEKLAKIYPNLKLLDAHVPRDEFEQYILNSDIVLLPYDPMVYWNRGSAIFFESIERSKYMIGRGGCSFVDEMSEHGIIDKYYSIEQLTSIIEALISKPKEYIVKEGIRRHHVYKSLVGK